MSNSVTVFDDAWLAHARATPHPVSWVRDVLGSLDTGGTRYLDSIRVWFDKFPLTATTDKRALKSRLESLNDPDHLGGVNELSWWEFMRKTQVNAEPVATATTPRPDFRVLAPAEFFVEVSTLNLSDTEREKLDQDREIPLNHSDTLGRILRKAADEKKRQIAFAAGLKRPCALVLFDYTTWSGFATQFFRFLAKTLLEEPFEFSRLPPALSALVYVERKVFEGRIAISRDRSAVYYNPNASHPLPVGTFSTIGQFWCQMMEIPPYVQDRWFWLSEEKT